MTSINQFNPQSTVYLIYIRVGHSVFLEKHYRLSYNIQFFFFGRLPLLTHSHTPNLEMISHLKNYI